jgi:hypothetical protein
MWGNGTLTHSCRECKTHFSEHLENLQNIKKNYHMTQQFHFYYIRELKICPLRICTQIASSFITAQKWRQPEYPLTDE